MSSGALAIHGIVSERGITGDTEVIRTPQLEGHKTRLVSSELPSGLLWLVARMLMSVYGAR